MPFKKGQSGNPMGKPLGTINKTSKDFKEMVRSILENELVSLPERLMKIPDKERILISIKLLEFVLPKNPNEKDTGNELWELIANGTIQLANKNEPKLVRKFKSMK